MELVGPNLWFFARMNWQRYCYDGLLAAGGTFLITLCIWLFKLPTGLPDSLLIYLLIILTLAYLRGLYAAWLASLLAFFLFDFLFIAPIYSLRITKFEDILTLIVFLGCSLITSRLAAALRLHAARAQRRFRETQLLYEIVCAANQEEDMEDQLRLFMQAIVELFAPYGVYDSLVLLCDADGVVYRSVGLRPLESQPALLLDEQKYRVYALTHTCTLDLEQGMREGQVIVHKQARYARFQQSSYTRLVPLKNGTRSIGVLRLLVAHSPTGRLHMRSGREPKSGSTDLYFSTLLEQAIAVIERDRLRRESIQAQVLQQSENLRASLLSSVSHNLRTPLATIKMSATSLQDTDTRGDTEIFVGSIVKEIDRLDGLVENLLDMSRIEAGVLQPDKGWYMLDELLYDVLERMEPLLSERSVEIDVKGELLPTEFDYVQIDQVITNLLENALYYTPAGSPIDITVGEREAELYLQVADRGPGIALAEQTHVFDKFYRLAPGVTGNEHKGTGLGLAICRGLIEAHGGRIWVEPREGGGSLFSFTLPREQAEGESLGKAKTNLSC